VQGCRECGISPCGVVDPILVKAESPIMIAEQEGG
jgi:hypothetical protein